YLRSVNSRQHRIAAAAVSVIAQRYCLCLSLFSTLAVSWLDTVSCPPYSTTSIAVMLRLTRALYYSIVVPLSVSDRTESHHTSSPAETEVVTQRHSTTYYYGLLYCT
ncbi:unnamed protein product, partial [Sphacelaria rigidula]